MPDGKEQQNIWALDSELVWAAPSPLSLPCVPELSHWPEAPGEFFQPLRTSIKMPFQRDAMADATRVLAASIVLPIICYVLFKVRMGIRSSEGIPLPPGPPGLPFIGNAHQVLGKNMVTVIDRWAKEYGPLVHIRLFGKSVIIISSSEVAKDLLESRHKNYSGRPNFIMASKAMQDDMMMPFLHANDRFFRVHKLVTTELRPAAVRKYFNPIQTAEVHRLVRCMLEEPKQWMSFVERAVASILMTAVYDKPMKSNESAEDAVKKVIKLNNDLINVIDGGQNYVDFLPWLQYIPGVPYKAVAADYYDLAERTYKSLMDEAKRNFERGKPATSIAARLLQSQSEVEADYREQYWALGSFYLAGSDTQSMATQSFIMALALNPDVLARAQAEVDNVVGDDRCPTYDDEERLPYVRAMVREVLRWRPTGPTAIPHASVQDDEYKGYFIPGGSMVIPNIWSMQMDPKVFEQPETYNPQRYLDDPDLPFHAFGFGDRVCPGRRVAETTLFLTFATIVWAVDVRPAISPETGKPIPINSDRETGFAPVGLLRALPFEVSLTPRFSARAQLLARITEDDDL